MNDRDPNEPTDQGDPWTDEEVVDATYEEDDEDAGDDDEEDLEALEDEDDEDEDLDVEVVDDDDLVEDDDEDLDDDGIELSGFFDDLSDGAFLGVMHELGIDP